MQESETRDLLADPAAPGRREDSPVRDDVEMGRPTRKDGNPDVDADEETDYRPVNWRKIFLSPKYIPFHIIGIALIVITIIITVKHDAVVAKLRPFSEKLRDLPAGWLIPIAILIVISFPPLFGHEIVALLCGVVWGLWIGFGIVAAGTFFGELATWYLFKYALRKRAQKLERTNINYGALARLTRDGGFWVVLVIRLSVIPSHFSTAVFSTCNVKFWHFAVATFLALPKQLVLVYLGVLLVQTQDDNTVKTVLFVGTGILTVVLAVWIWMRMQRTKKVLLEEQEQRRRNREMARLKETDEVARMPVHGHVEEAGMSYNGAYDARYGIGQAESSYAPQVDSRFAQGQQDPPQYAPARVDPRYAERQAEWI